MTGKIKILFLIPSLVAAGAERQLCELVRNMDGTRFEIHVVLFYDPKSFEGVELSPLITSLPNVTLHCLYKQRGFMGYPRALGRLIRIVARVKPDLLHGYLDGNLPVLLVGRLFRKPSVWGIRAASRDTSFQSRASVMLAWMMVKTSRLVSLVICNSQAGKRVTEEMGLRAPRTIVIPNGFDLTLFRPDPEAGARQRASWGIPADVPLIGNVGRFDPVKDHATFLRAAALISRERPDARFICVGLGPADYLSALKAQAQTLGLGDKVLWPGVSSAMTGVYNALSLHVLTSIEEGFPNVIGEAMACGIPCVSTRAGDAADMIGETGLVAEVGDAEGVARAVLRVLAEPPEQRAARGRAAAARIVSTFGTQTLARRTEDVLLGLLAPAR